MRLAAVLALGILLAGCAESPADKYSGPAAAASRCDPDALPAPDASWKAEKPRVRLTTSRGVIVAELEQERAPITTANFVKLAESGFYDNTTFHRVVRDFVVQGGDPLTRDADPSNDGMGDPGYEIPDEFHPALRHDAAGILSMANGGPGTGGSQFFLTLGPTPHLDDRHSVFGRVVEGLPVVRSMGAAQVDGDDRPLEPIRLERVEVLEPTSEEARHGADAHVVIPTKKAEPGRELRFAVVLKNTGNTRDRLAIGATPPEGWKCTLDQPAVVPAGTGRVVFLSLTPPADASGTARIPVYVTTSAGATGEGELNVTITSLGRQVKDGDKVTANYAGLLLDGRLFDTSMERVGKDPEQPKFETTGGFRPKPAYSTFPFTVGGGVIEGFTKLAKTAKEGETVTSFIPAREAYAQGNMYERPLTGRDLVFELEIVRLG